MKLRLRGSSIRLRLTRGEVARIGAGERVEEIVAFAAAGGTNLVYAVTTSREAERIAATFSGAEIRVVIPAAVAHRWATTEDVGIEAEQPIAGGPALKILIEKDFECLAPRAGEDDSDAYPNPSKSGS